MPIFCTQKCHYANKRTCMLWIHLKDCKQTVSQWRCTKGLHQCVKYGLTQHGVQSCLQGKTNTTVASFGHAFIKHIVQGELLGNLKSNGRISRLCIFSLIFKFSYIIILHNKHDTFYCFCFVLLLLFLFVIVFTTCFSY